MKTALDSARAYLAKLPAAVSGAGGHKATFAAACWTVRLGLDDSDALALLREFNQRCQPPWKEAELGHKLRDARRAAGGQVRNFRQPAPPARLVWKLERKTPPACPPPPPPPPPPAPPPEPQRPAPLPPVLDPQRPAFELTERHVIRPGDPIPAALLPVLQSWRALRKHPAWSGVQWPPETPRQIGWTRRGEPVYANRVTKG